MEGWSRLILFSKLGKKQNNNNNKFAWWSTPALYRVRFTYHWFKEYIHIASDSLLTEAELAESEKKNHVAQGEAQELCRILEWVYLFFLLDFLQRQEIN